MLPEIIAHVAVGVFQLQAHSASRQNKSVIRIIMKGRYFITDICIIHGTLQITQRCIERQRKCLHRVAFSTGRIIAIDRSGVSVDELFLDIDCIK